MTGYVHGRSKETQRLQRLHKLIADAEGTLRKLQGDAAAAQSVIDHAKQQEAEAFNRRKKLAAEARAFERRAAKAEARRKAAESQPPDEGDYERARQSAIAAMTVEFYNQGTARLEAATREAESLWDYRPRRNPNGLGMTDNGKDQAA